MPTIFNFKKPAKEAESPAAKADFSDTDTQSQSKDQNSKPSSEKESTLVNEPIRDSTPDNTNKEPAGDDSPQEVIPNTDSNKEPVPKEGAQVEETKESVEGEEKQDDTEYPSAWRLLLITIALCLCVFCVALVCVEWVLCKSRYGNLRYLQDNTIIATAIPKITDQFNSLQDVGWYGSSYLLTTCCVTLIFGKLYTFYSIKWIYLIALSIFEVGSLVCAVTPTSVGLICGRAIAGLGAAGLFSGSILIITQSVPLVKRPMYTGLVGSMFGIANVAGPLYVIPFS